MCKKCYPLTRIVVSIRTEVILEYIISPYSSSISLFLSVRYFILIKIYDISLLKTAEYERL